MFFSKKKQNSFDKYLWMKPSVDSETRGFGIFFKKLSSLGKFLQAINLWPTVKM